MDKLNKLEQRYRAKHEHLLLALPHQYIYKLHRVAKRYAKTAGIKPIEFNYWLSKNNRINLFV